MFQFFRTFLTFLQFFSLNFLGFLNFKKFHLIFSLFSSLFKLKFLSIYQIFHLVVFQSLFPDRGSFVYRIKRELIVPCYRLKASNSHTKLLNKILQSVFHVVFCFRRIKLQFFIHHYVSVCFGLAVEVCIGETTTDGAR